MRPRFSSVQTERLRAIHKLLRNLVCRLFLRLAAEGMGVRRNVLIVSSDSTFASLLARELGPDFDVHSAATDIAAFALMDAYVYGCVVLDLSARSLAGSASVSGLHLDALTIPVVALIPPGGENMLPLRSMACVNEGDPIPRLAKMVRDSIAA